MGGDFWRHSRMVRKRKLPELFVVEYSRNNIVEEYDESMFHDIDPNIDEEDSNERRGIEAAIDYLASEQDVSGVFKDGSGRVVIFSSLDDANRRAAALFKEMKREGVNGWDTADEEDEQDEDEEQEGEEEEEDAWGAYECAWHEVDMKYNVGGPNDLPFDDPKNLVTSTITVTVVAAVMGE